MDQPFDAKSGSNSPGKLKRNQKQKMMSVVSAKLQSEVCIDRRVADERVQCTLNARACVTDRTRRMPADILMLNITEQYVPTCQRVDQS